MLSRYDSRSGFNLSKKPKDKFFCPAFLTRKAGAVEGA